MEGHSLREHDKNPLSIHISSTPPPNSSGWVSKMTLLKKSNYKSNYFLFLAKGSMTWTNGILFTLSLVWTVLGSKLLLQFSLSPVQLSNGGGEKKFGNSKLKLTKNLSKCPNSDSFKNCGKKLILVWWCSKFGRCYIAQEGFFLITHSILGPALWAGPQWCELHKECFFLLLLP